MPLSGRSSVTRLQSAGLAIVGLGASIAPLDFSVNIAFPAITAAFGLETRAIRWVAACYEHPCASLMLVFGALGDRIGHLRRLRTLATVSISVPQSPPGP